MAGTLHKIWRWLLVPLIAAASLFAAFVLSFNLPVLVPWLAIKLAISIGLNVPSWSVVPVADTADVFLTSAVLIIPVAWAIGFALKARIRVSLVWGLSFTLLLLSVYVWFNKQQFARSFAVTSGILLFSGLALLVLRRRNVRTILILNLGALLLLLGPRLIPLISGPKLPPRAHKVWSVVLQKGTWQAMNTGSEFGATRQLAFAGDRIIVVFDAGEAGYQGKEPMSHYRILSLDRATGAIKNQMEFTGPWGDMPYIYGTHNGKVVFVGAGPIKLLSPDLTPTGIELTYKGIIDTISPDGTTLAWQTIPGITFLSTDTLQPIAKMPDAESGSIAQKSFLTTSISWPGNYPKGSEFVTLVDPSGDHLLFHGNCGTVADFLTENHILLVGCGAIRIVNTKGTTLVASKSIGPLGTFAGVSQTGRRFALEYSDERGDPELLLYEQFIIYDATTAQPLVIVPIHDLPDRQSWSAFSADGHFFAVGNPDQLTLYQIP